jgi:DNA (cytosine-5)-methyltransferase 1
LRSGASANYQLVSGIRRLTEIECERLQGFPDDWTKYGTNDKGETITTSRTQRYKMCGNAVTVAVVKMIGDRLIQTMQNPQQ